MRYLTKKQINYAAKRGEKAAIKCSIRHWKELREASLEDLKNWDSSGATIIVGHSACALCRRHSTSQYDDTCVDCNACSLGRKLGSCGVSECNPYRKADRVYNQYFKSWKLRRKWQRACDRMIKVLESLL